MWAVSALWTSSDLLISGQYKMLLIFLTQCFAGKLTLTTPQGEELHPINRAADYLVNQFSQRGLYPSL